MAKVSTSRVLSKIKKKSKGAWKKSRSKEAQARGQQIPGGIIRGVAQFSKYNISETEDSKKTPYITLSAVVKEPEEYAGCPLSITHRFEETERASIEDKMDKFSSDLQLLGVDTEEITEDDWEDALKGLKQEGPHFYFNTRSWSFKNKDGETVDGVSIFIQGLAEDWDEDEDVTIEEEAEEESDEEAEPEDDEEGDEDDADQEPEEEEGDEEEAEEEEDEDWEPAKGEVYLYKASPKGKPKECEVVSVNKSKKTVTLKRSEDDKKFLNIAWDKLEGAE